MSLSVDKESGREEQGLVFRPVYFATYGGKVWSPADGIDFVLTNSVKVCGALFAGIVAQLPIDFACGKTTSLLSDLGLMDSAHNWSAYGLNLRVTNSWLLSASQFCSTYVSQPTEYLRQFFWSYTPSIQYNDIHISRLFIATVLEDLVCIGLIQRTALPLLAKLLPERCGDVLNHKITRVVLASAIFALSHQDIARQSPMGVLPQFIGGLVSGAIAEMDDSLLVPIMSHFAYDLMLGMGRNPRLG